MIVFDIGSNRGEYANNILRKDSSSKVICVEPNPNIFPTLISNLPQGTIAYNKAVSNEKGSIEFFECFEDNTVSTVSKTFLENSCFSTSTKVMSNGKMFKDHYSYKNPIMVETITLDELIAIHGNPDLIKVDVEGYELEVLKSLSAKSGKITFEWHETFMERVIETVRHLKNIGYEEFGTPMWHKSSDYNDGEIADKDYLKIDEFIQYFTESLKFNEEERDWVERSGMIWAK